MRWRQKQNQSHWRQFEFMLHQVRRAVHPHLPLGEVIEHWPEICRRLAEAPRKRRPRGFPFNTEANQTS
jgi:hypothetical protein